MTKYYQSPREKLLWKCVYVCARAHELTIKISHFPTSKMLLKGEPYIFISVLSTWLWLNHKHVFVSNRSLLFLSAVVSFNGEPAKRQIKWPDRSIRSKCNGANYCLQHKESDQRASLHQAPQSDSWPFPPLDMTAILKPLLFHWPTLFSLSSGKQAVFSRRLSHLPGSVCCREPDSSKPKGSFLEGGGGSQEINTHHMYGEAETYRIHEGRSLACRNRKQLMERRRTRPSWREHVLGLVASSASHGEWSRDAAFLTPCLYWVGFSVMQGHLSATCSWK